MLASHHYSLAFVFAALELHVARLRVWYASLGAGVALLVVVLGFIFFVPAASFPLEEPVTIESGDTLYDIALRLEESGYIRSKLLFMGVARLTGLDTRIQQGTYIFHTSHNQFQVLYNLAHGITGIEMIRVALLEGMTAHDMGDALEKALPGFSQAEFEDKAIPLEGYLFPDTYFFPTDVTPDEVIERLIENFYVHIEDIDAELTAFDRALPDVIIMASLLEREARSLSEKRMVAGILWHRLSIDMPLQVDAVFGYINNRATYNPSFSDLEIDSPYNTYKNKGLPPGPIANPGLASLLAAVTPTRTEYLYYLTGRNGHMYYAKTFAEHKQNRARYLD